MKRGEYIHRQRQTRNSLTFQGYNGSDTLHRIPDDNCFVFGCAGTFRRVRCRSSPQTWAAVVTVAGDALGTVVHICVALAGLSWLIGLSEIVLPVLQIAGGCFVVFLAISAFRNARHPSVVHVTAKGSAIFWAGFFTCVSNPKAIVFFVALFPAFINPNLNMLVQGAVYGAIFLVLDAFTRIGYALAAHYAVQRTVKGWLNIDVLSGLGLAGVGLGMVIKGWRSLPSN